MGRPDDDSDAAQIRKATGALLIAEGLAHIRALCQALSKSNG